MLLTRPNPVLAAAAGTVPRGTSGRSWLSVVAAKDKSKPTEILISGQIGSSFWDDSGVSADQFRNALKAIPEDRDIIVGINSEGGSVSDGLSIYNAIRAREDKITCRVDGYACSIASVVAIAGHRTVSPKTSIWMIHDPWTWTEGNADEMRKAAEMLDTHAEALLAAYRDKTGKSAAAIRAAMKFETWKTGEEAAAWGLCDETTDDAPDLESVTVDARRHASMPRHILNLITKSPANSGAKTEEENMNRAAILALLKRHGITPTDNATDAELIAEVHQLVIANKVTEVEVQAASAPVAATPAPVVLAAVATPAPAPIVFDQALVTALQLQVANLTARSENERVASVTARVDSAVQECRIPVAQRANWIRRASVDESVLADIQSLPQTVPGSPAVTLLESAETSVQDIEQTMNRLSGEAIAARMRGNSITPSMIQDNAMSVARIYAQHRSKLLPVLAANTIGAGLNRQVILQEMMRAFGQRIMSLQAFSTVFQNVPLQGTDVIQIPYYPLVSAASTDFVPANGYVMGDSSISTKSVTINKRKYQPIVFSSVELDRMPQINTKQIAIMKAEKLAADVFADALSVVTAANYGAAAFTGIASTFDEADVADLKGVADVAEWPDTTNYPWGRSLVVKSAYDVNLLKSAGIKAALNYGSSDPIQEGVIRQIYGFNYYMNNNLPANGENLVGFISFPSAILFATSPVMPALEVRQQLAAYEVIVHPSLGVAFEYRRWGNPDMDQRREVIEMNYGFAVGEVAALKRLVSA